MKDKTAKIITMNTPIPSKIPPAFSTPSFGMTAPIAKIPAPIINKAIIPDAFKFMLILVGMAMKMLKLRC